MPDFITPDPVQDRTPEKPYGAAGPLNDGNADGWSDNTKAKRHMIEDPEGVIDGTAPELYWDMLVGHRHGGPSTGNELIDLWNELVKEEGGTAVLARTDHA